MLSFIGILLVCRILIQFIWFEKVFKISVGFFPQNLFLPLRLIPASLYARSLQQVRVIWDQMGNPRTINFLGEELSWVSSTEFVPTSRASHLIMLVVYSKFGWSEIKWRTPELFKFYRTRCVAGFFHWIYSCLEVWSQHRFMLAFAASSGDLRSSGGS